MTPTGAPTGAPPEAVAQQGEYLTTSQGARLRDTDHSLRAGPRGPVLLQDHHLREKITHFDHERIPERVVHARGTGAHGVFVANGNASRICCAAFLGKGVETPVFVRFSTVVGFRGSADTVRDTRGFATKFYTSEGNYDLVANNIPVFFIQDGIKFPDIIHAAKPHPDTEIPQAGLRQPPHRGAGPRRLADVGPGHPAVVPHDGGLRHPHLPPGQRRRGDLAGEVPLEAASGRALAGLGRSPADGRGGSRLPPSGPLRRPRRRRLPVVGPAELLPHDPGSRKDDS